MDNLEKILIDNQKINNNLNDLMLLITNQQIQINNLIQIINMQSQLMNEFKMDMYKFLLKINDMEIRSNINEEGISDINNNIVQVIDAISEIKSAVDNIKIYQLPDNYFG